MITKLVPTVRRRYLFAFAGMMWTVAGCILCVRGTIWMCMLPPEVEFIVAVLCVAIAAAAYTFGFSKVVQKSIDRIRQMPERANIFAFTAGRGYAMIALMITVGMTLRNSSIPKYYLTIPYDAMGGVLLIGSVRFYQQFIAIVLQTES